MIKSFSAASRFIRSWSGPDILTYPTRKVEETQFSIFHPIRKPIGPAIEQAVFEKLNDVMSKRDAGHDRINAGPASV
jgi:DNA-binding cell septation regulator SpoVG